METQLLLILAPWLFSSTYGAPHVMAPPVIPLPLTFIGPPTNIPSDLPINYYVSLFVVVSIEATFTPTPFYIIIAPAVIPYYFTPAPLT